MGSKRKCEAPSREISGRSSPAATLALALILGLSAPVDGAERWDGLRVLPRVALEVTVSPVHPDLAPDELRWRVEDVLRQAQPAPVIDAGSADRLHLTVAVRSYSSADLRGFYLPFSGFYGIGPVRLAVERPALLPGLAAPTLVQVWQAERQAKGRWQNSAAEIRESTASCRPPSSPSIVAPSGHDPETSATRCRRQTLTRPRGITARPTSR